MPVQAEREPLVPLEDVLRYTGLTRSAYYSLRHRGEGPPTYRLGRRLMFKWPEVLAWVETRRDAPRATAPPVAAS
jgi:predicted DNA-binding transcriptional regulator AlpA